MGNALGKATVQPGAGPFASLPRSLVESLGQRTYEVSEGFGLSKDDRIRLQRRLTARGFDAGGADGVIGNNTRTAISAYQTSIGRPATGDPSQELLRTLGG